MIHSLFFSDSGIVGRLFSGFFASRTTILSPNESVKIFKTITKLVFLFFLIIPIIDCNQAGKVDKTESNNNLLYGLVIGQNQIKDTFAEINGYWEDYYYFGGVFIKSGNLIIATNLNGTGTWSTTGTTSNDRVNRIAEFNNSTNILYYQQGQGTNNFGGGSDYRSKFGRIVWTTPTSEGCESSAQRCFYYCELVFQKNSLEEAKSDTSQANSSNPTSSGCGGSSWSRALSRQGNPNW